MPGAADRPTINQPDGFVSYASADRDRVLPVVDALIRAGVPVWIDRDDIHGGTNDGREITGANGGAAAVVSLGGVP